MSHVATYKTRILNPHLDLLRTVFAAVAARHDGKVTEQIKGYFKADDREVTIGLTTPDFPRGLGVTVGDDGALEFICDPYAFEGRVEELKAEIIRTYQSVAVSRVLAALGYTVTSDSNAHGTLVEGVRAA